MVDPTYESDDGPFEVPVWQSTNPVDLVVHFTPLLPEERPEAPRTGPIPCDGCGATVVASQRDGRRGSIACNHCRGLTLLVAPEAMMRVLGAPKAGDAAWRYRIEEQPDHVSILPLEDGPSRGSIEVAGDRMILRRTGSKPVELAGRDLEGLCIRERPRSDKAFSLEDGLKAAQRFAAFSGNVDLRQVILAAAGAASFRVSARHPQHGEIVLADQLQDLREAFLIVQTLRRVLAKAA